MCLTKNGAEEWRQPILTITRTQLYPKGTSL
jgi:hypothetical protein